jgi:ATP-dependent Clp protease ATP-binding subunit ClpC
MKLNSESIKFLLEKGYDQKYGARPLRRALERYLEDELSELLLRGEFEGASCVNVKKKKNEDKLTFVPVKDKVKKDEEIAPETVTP